VSASTIMPAPIESPLTPLSDAQRSAWQQSRLAPREEVSPDVWALALPIAGGAMPYTLCYALLEPAGVHIIDPGWDSDENIEVLAAELAGLRRSLSDVRTVIATHSHPDHLGLAPRLRELSGAVVIVSARERDVLRQESGLGEEGRRDHDARLSEWGVPIERRAELEAFFRMPFALHGFEPDRAVEDGEIIGLPGHRLEAVLTPGHTSGHLCLVDHERKLLYSGDHVLPRIASGVGLGALPDTDPLDDYLSALERVGLWDEMQVLPGHEYRFRGLADRSRALAEHHLRRTREVAALVPELGDAPIWEYARRLTWTGGWSGISGFFLDSALRQTALHREFIRSGRAARRPVWTT